MSTNVPNEDQEIDLSNFQRGKKVSQEISKQIYKGIRFIIKKECSLLLLTGFGLGALRMKKIKSIVMKLQ
jgi:hypothetical protein